MSLDVLFVGFLQRIAVGAGMVFAVLLFIRLRMPRRSPIINRNTTEKLP